MILRFFKKLLLWLILIIALLAFGLYIFGYGYLLRAVQTVYFNGHVTAFLDDYQYFDNVVIENSSAQPWPIATSYNKVRPTTKLENLHKQTGTVAFLVIKNDSLWHEAYFDGYGALSRSNSFSMAKSIVSAALGKAIMQGKIKSLDQPVGDFYPEFASGKMASITVGDLSSMASGLNWDENYYSPFSVTTRAYFDSDLAKTILNQKLVETPGQSYKYLSGNTQLLAMVIQKATKQPLNKFVSENFWKPLGAENDALWQTDDENGMVKAFCCIASNARDFARFGKLYKDFGRWNGKKILDSSFVARSTRPRFPDAPQYGYGFWLADYKGRDIFYMRGHLGQYTIVIPKDNLIIVRLGNRHIKSTTGSPHSDDFFVYIDEVYNMLGAKKAGLEAAQ